MIDDDWKVRASAIIRSILTRRNIKYHELAIRLNGIGVEETQSSISNKISRGTFSFVFFIQCMEVLNIDEVRID